MLRNYHTQIVELLDPLKIFPRLSEKVQVGLGSRAFHIPNAEQWSSINTIPLQESGWGLKSLLRAYWSRSVLVTLVFLSVFSSELLAQKEELPGPELVIIKASNGAERHYKEGKRITVKTLDNRRISGRFKVTEDWLIVDSDSIRLSDIRYIRTKSLASKITGGILTTLGGGVELIGLGFLYAAVTTSDPCAALVYAISAIVIIPVGAIVLLPGIAVLTIGKRHKAEKNIFELRMNGQEPLEIGQELFSAKPIPGTR